MLRVVLERLRGFAVLDPAAVRANFLAPHALKDIEHRVQLEVEAMGLQRAFPEIGPANVKGIEINAYAAEPARVSVWIGEIQWMRRNGCDASRDPILKPLETAECRDAIRTSDGLEPGWLEADVATLRSWAASRCATDWAANMSRRFDASTVRGLATRPVRSAAGSTMRSGRFPTAGLPGARSEKLRERWRSIAIAGRPTPAFLVPCGASGSCILENVRQRSAPMQTEVFFGPSFP